MVDRPCMWQAVHGTDPRGGANSMMINVGVRDDHTAEAVPLAAPAVLLAPEPPSRASR